MIKQALTKPLLLPASKERVASLRAGLQRECDAAIEDLLLTPAYHDEWKDAPVYTLLTDTFLPTFTLFKRYAPYSMVVDAKAHTPVTAAKTPSRNAPCPCDSGKKFKNCCGK